MESPSAGLEPEAYLPHAPKAAGERHWPSSSRAIAIEWARQARHGVEGLAVDDVTLERVADAVMDAYTPAPPARLGSHPTPPPGWVPLTAEERENRLSGGLWNYIQGYLSRHPEAHGRVDVGWRDERQTFVVGVVGDPQPHRAALARIGGERVAVESRPSARPHTYAELEAIESRIRAHERELTTANLSVVRVETDPWRGVVEVQVVGGPRERDGAAESLAARYGDAVAVRWLGPNRFLEPLHPFASWTSDGRRIRVFFALDPNGQQPGRARVAEENDERVVIALTCLDPIQTFRTRIGGFDARHADLELREPVGARAVLDASAGVVRPSLAQLGSRPRRWRQPARAGVLPATAPGGVAEPADLLIEELELSIRAGNRLHAKGVETVDDLLRLSAEQVATLPNMNRNTFDEIVDALAAQGLSLTREGKG